MLCGLSPIKDLSSVTTSESVERNAAERGGGTFMHDGLAAVHTFQAAKILCHIISVQLFVSFRR